MATDLSGLAAGELEKLAAGNADLQALQPELDAAIQAVASLAQKAVIYFGGKLVGKFLPALMQNAVQAN